MQAFIASDERLPLMGSRWHTVLLVYNPFMVDLVALEPVDYLVIGHVTEDVTPAGPRLGGTVTFSSLTARALGLRVGIITSAGPSTSLGILDGIQLLNVPSPKSTGFENSRTSAGRKQLLKQSAARIALDHVPEVWRRTSIVHLAPVAQELGPESANPFSPSLLGITPQGWMRKWDAAGHVKACEWKSAHVLLPLAGAVVMSREDVEGNEELMESMAHETRVLVVTEDASGSVVYWNGDRRRFRAPEVTVVDDVGAGDIYAAAFFVRLYATRDPWEAARFATLLAAHSVTRPGLAGIPTAREIEDCSMEVLK